MTSPAHSTAHDNQQGFTLLEMLLAVGIVAALMVMVSQISTDFIQQRNAQTAGQTIYRIADVTEDVILRSSPNIPGPGGFVVAGSGPPVGADIQRALDSNDFDVSSGSTLRIARSPVAVLYGINTSGAGPASGMLFIRTMVALSKPFPITQASKIARAIGARGGLIRWDKPGEIISAHGNWTYTIPDYLNAPLNTAGVGIPPTGQAYVVSYRAIAPSDARGPYLNVYGDGNANVMYQDILMNGNSVLRAKDIDAATVTATKGARFDQLAVNGIANFQGGIDANDAVNVGGDLTVADGDMSVTNGDLLVPGGNINAKGLRADKLEADELTTTDLSTQTLTVDGGNTLIANNLTVSGGATMDITGPLKATVVDADSITTDTMRTKTMDVKGTTTLSGPTTINNTANIDQLVLDGCMLLNGVRYGTGC